MLVFALSPEAAQNNAPTIASAVTLAAVVAQGVLSHLKGRRGRREGGAHLERIETKIDDALTRQSEVNQTVEIAINTLSSHVVGPDGRNGLRSRVVRLEYWKEQLDRTAHEKANEKAHEKAHRPLTHPDEEP